MRHLKSRLALTLFALGLLASSRPASAAGYHNPGQYFGTAPLPYQAHDSNYYHYYNNPVSGSIGREGTGSYGTSNYQPYYQPYYPSQPNYSSGGFRATTLDSNYSTSGVYRTSY